MQIKAGVMLSICLIFHQTPDSMLLKVMFKYVANNLCHKLVTGIKCVQGLLLITSQYVWIYVQRKETGFVIIMLKVRFPLHC